MTAKHPVEVSPDEWMLPDRVGFLDWVHDTFKYTPEQKASTTKSKGGSGGSGSGNGSGSGIGKLFVQQRFVRDYLQAASPYRGIVLFHGLGVGKSCASIAAAEALGADAGRKIIIMTPASLKRNYIEEIKKCGAREVDPLQAWRKQEGDDGGKNWVANATSGTHFDQLSAADQDAIQSMLSKKIHARYQFISYNGVTAKRVQELTAGSQNIFDNAVVIIDEAHNFVSRVSHNGLLTAVYQRIMDSPTCKVILLSGTPLINKPMELAYLVDLARGYTSVVNVTLNNNNYNKNNKNDSKRTTTTTTAFSQDQLIADVESVPGVDRAELSEDAMLLRVQLLPPGFVKSADNKNKKKEGFVVRAPTDEKEIIANVKSVAQAHTGVNNAVLAKRLPLPVDGEAFDSYFVRRNDPSSDSNARQFDIVNIGVIESRVIGCVSFYSAYDPALYPRVTKTQVVSVPMSARQFTEYSIKRDVERKREETARRFAKRNPGGGDASSSTESGTYRAYSRSLCNFVFPEGIQRPYPADMRKMIDDDGAAQDDEDDPADNADGGQVQPRPTSSSYQRQYFAALNKAIDATAQHKTALLLDGHLRDHSPKYDAIIRKLEANRVLSIVYSAFRKAEGIHIFSTALLANGWARLYVQWSSDAGQAIFKMEGRDVKASISNKRVFAVYDKADNEDVGVALLNAFNSNSESLPSDTRASLSALYPPASPNEAALDNTHGGVARVLLLPPSGAEGLSLRNVREVHLMEPFWHTNRIDQVIGRAVRAGSHTALPPAERLVDIYMYIASFTKAQCENNATIRMKDACMTSDQFVQNLARRKKATIDSILDVMRRAAVDCRIHSGAHNDRIKCAMERAGPSSVGTPRNRILVEDDVADALNPQTPSNLGQAQTSTRAASNKNIMDLAVAVDGLGNKVLVDRATGDTYDYDAYKRSGALKRLGGSRETIKKK